MESFGELLRSPGHWAFEIFLMVLFDGIIVGLLFPFARKHWKHHIARDQAEIVQDWSGAVAGQIIGKPSEEWPDPGTERCMNCMGLILRVSPDATKCSRCGSVNPRRRL